MILETALAGVSGSENGLVNQQSYEVVGVDVAQQAGNEDDEQSYEVVGVDVARQAGNEDDEQSENPLSLDSSLETVFGPGAVSQKVGN